MARPETGIRALLESILSEPIPQSVLAWLSKVTPGRVSQLVADGVLRRGDSGIQWLHGYQEHLREMAAGRQSATIGGLDPVQEGAALKKVQRERIELQNNLTRQEQAPIDLLGEALAKAIQVMVSELDRVDGLIAQTAPDLPEATRMAVLNCIATARNKAAACIGKLEIGPVDPADDIDAEGDA